MNKHICYEDLEPDVYCTPKQSESEPKFEESIAKKLYSMYPSKKLIKTICKLLINII